MDVRRIVIYYIKHIHRIGFGSPVFCEPTLVRLHPSLGPHINVHFSRLQVEPNALKPALQQDVNGNVCWQLLFDDISVDLKITVISRVEVWPQSWSQVLSPAAVTVPMMHSDSEAELANFFAKPLGNSQLLHDYANRIKKSGDGTAMDFVNNLLWGFQQHYVPAASGEFWQDETSHAFAEVARTMNIPARLVRGYKAAMADEIESRLGVWAELYLPGAGWIGYDPAEGCAANESYIALCKAKTLGEVEPVEGNYRGTQKAPQMETQIIIRQAVQHDRGKASGNSAIRGGGRRFYLADDDHACRDLPPQNPQ